MNTKTPNARLAQPTIGTRFTRSASHPIGTAPSTKNADDAGRDEHDGALLIPNVLRISGASTLIAAPSSSSNDSSSSEHDEHELAADLERVVERHRLGVHAGEEVVGEDDLLARRASGRPRARLPRRARSRREMPRSIRSPPASSVNTVPPTRELAGGSPRGGSVPGSRGTQQLPVGYCRRGGRDLDLDDCRRRHFAEHGWVVVDALPRRRAAHARGMGRRGRRAPRGRRGVLQHFGS